MKGNPIESFQELIEDPKIDFLDHLPFIEKDRVGPIFKEIKEKFYDQKQYKWSIKKCLECIDTYAISPDHFLKSFLYCINSYNTLAGNFIGYKACITFSDRLQTSKKFQSKKHNYTGYHLLHDEEIFEFLLHMKKAKSYINISHNKWIRYIYNNFKTGYSFDTLRKYYYDKF
jgi:hypothetical protein